MKLEEGKISPGQLCFLLMSANFANSLLNPPAANAGGDEWLVILASLGLGLMLTIIFARLSLKFPGQTLVEFNNIIYGKFLGRTISLAYLFYYFILATITIRLYSDFLSGIIFPSTPQIVFAGILTLICASATRNGIEVIARMSQLLVPIMLILIVITLMLGLPAMKFLNFLPIFDLPLKEFVKLSFHAASFPFGETLAISLLLLAFTGQKQKEVKKAGNYLFLGILASGIVLIIMAIRNTGILGNTKAFTTYPSYEAARLINVADVLTRMEIVVAIDFLVMGFLVISLLYYAITLGLAQVLELRSYLPLVLPLGIILVCVSITQFDNTLEYSKFSAFISPYFSFPFIIVLPLLSLLICKIRGIPK